MEESYVPVGGIAEFVARVGSWNLHDLRIRAVRVSALADSIDAQIDIVVPDWIGAEGSLETVFTLACHDVEELELASFSDDDDISSYTFSLETLPSGRAAGIQVILETVAAGSVLRCYAARVDMLPGSSVSARSA